MSEKTPKLASSDWIDPNAVDDKAIRDLIAEIQSNVNSDPILANCSAAEIDTALPVITQHRIPLNNITQEIGKLIKGYTRKNAHSGLFSYILAPGLPTDPPAHALTAAINQNITGFHASPFATQLEKKLVRFFLI